MQASSTMVLIVAAGRGNRLAGAMPKQYLPLGGVSLLRRSVRAFLDHPGIDGVKVVIHPEDAALYAAAVKGLPLLPPVCGGAERQDSVRLGLESLQGHHPRYVLIHDAARPFVCAALITRIIEGLQHHPAVIPVLPVIDTVKRITDGMIANTLNRNALMMAQTPQGFAFPQILEYHEQFKDERCTDDSALCEHAGGAVYPVTGEAGNFKITTDDDMLRASAMLGYETRIGMGVDAHRFTEAKHEHNTIMLCGIPVPHDQSLEAHSDGDVGLHALVDALLGALGAGDIGMHFPPTDERWRNAASSDFLTYTHELVKKAGGRIINVDITIIGEAPKVNPYRDSMVQRVAEILGIAATRVSVKATTTEEMGFTGRKEGLVAQAVANITLPGIND